MELTKAGELKAIEGRLSHSIRSLLGVDENFSVFVPYASYTKGGRTVSVRLIEGYAFVATGLPEVRYFGLERSPLVAKVFSSRVNGLRVLHTLPNREVDGMRSRLADSMSADFEVGTQVRITGGNYRDLDGVIVDLYDKQIAIQVEFRSLTSIAVVPRTLATFLSQGSPKALEPEDPVSLDELMENGAGL